MLRRLRPLNEAECYARCYGNGDESVRVARVAKTEPSRRRPPIVRMSGEDLRRLFEERLDKREKTAA